MTGRRAVVYAAGFGGAADLPTQVDSPVGFVALAFAGGLTVAVAGVVLRGLLARLNRRGTVRGIDGEALRAPRRGRRYNN